MVMERGRRRAAGVFGGVLAAFVAAGCTAGAPPERVDPAVDAVCCGATCCLIGGVCRHMGDMNPANRCQECDPSRNQRRWTTIAGCTTSRDAGGGGSCCVTCGGGTKPCGDECIDERLTCTRTTPGCACAGGSGGGGGCSVAWSTDASWPAVPAVLAAALVVGRRRRRRRGT